MDVSKLMQNDRLRSLLASLSSKDLDAIAEYVKDNQIVIKNEVYYSRVCFQPAVAKASGTATLTLPKGTTLKAFGYGQGESLESAGYASGTAEQIHTNLIARSETNNNEIVVVDGLAIEILDADPVLAQAILPNVYVSAGFGGDTNTYKFGLPTFWPGAGGLFGGGFSYWGDAPNLGDSQKSFQSAAVCNGSPFAADYRPTEKIVWKPKGSADSSFNVFFQLQKALSVTGSDRAAATGVNAVTVPSARGAAGTYVELMVKLFGTQLSVRGSNR